VRITDKIGYGKMKSKHKIEKENNEEDRKE